MLTQPAQHVFLVHARQDESCASALENALEAAGHTVQVRQIGGLPGKEFPPGEKVLATGSVTVVVVSGWLLCSSWMVSAEAIACHDTSVMARVDQAPVDGTPFADRPQFDAADALGWREAMAVATTNSPAAGLRRFGLLWLAAHADKAIRGLSAALGKCEAAPSLTVGGIIADRFRLVERIGNGPLASVWRAQDAQGGTVAVKVLHPQWVGTPTEESLGQTLGGEGLAEVLHVGRGEEVGTYWVRSWGPRTLASALETGEMTLAEAVQAVLDAGRGLRALHAAGRLHGAVKPNNLLFVDGRTLLADPGSAGMSGSDPTDVLFVAPETQEVGRSPGPASDLYALGMTAVNALYAAPLPFWVLRDPERLLAEIVAPDAVKDALRKALDWDPTRRFQTMDAFEEALLADETVVRLLCDHASNSGRHEAVTAYLGRLMAKGDRSSPSLLLAMGRAQLAKGEFDAARTSFEDATSSRLREETLAAARGLADLAFAVGGVDARVAELVSRAESLDPVGVELLIDAARLQAPDAARQTWRAVLDGHLERRHAQLALDFLVPDATGREDWAAVFRLGALQHGFLPAAGRGAGAYELGRIAMDHLRDPPRALTWLQIAIEEGVEETDLARRLEAIRSSRGEWRQVVSLMLERAEALSDEPAAVALMLRAARVALYAHNHHDDAASIMLRVLLRDPEHRQALRFLARYHARARRDDRALALYARLAPHEERGREGEALEVRVADNVDYARLLLRNDRPRGAQLCLEAALDLNPTHVPTLALASQLSFDLGKWEEARVATRGLVGAFSSAEADATFCGALRRLGNLAWLHGDLETASAHFNRVLELAPDDAESWWGRAKIAMAGNAGRLDEAAIVDFPWLTAAPVRITPHEALVRLLAGVLERASVERWMRLDPMGKEMHDLLSAQSDLVLLSAVVDLMVARQLVRGSLFRRLRTLRPAWERPIRAVEELWFAPLSRQTFPITESYRWGQQPSDFDPRHHRDPIRLSIDPEGPVDVRPSLSTLHHASAWNSLLAWDSALPSPPEAEEIEVGEGSGHSRSAVLVLFPDAPDRSGIGSPARRVLRVGDGDIIGAAMDEVSLPLATLEPEHLRFEAVGDFLYVRALGPLTVDGQRVTERRLVGGETLRIGTVDARFHLYEEDIDGRRKGRQILNSKLLSSDPTLDAAFVHNPKAALFYTEGVHERMLPVVGKRVGVYEDVEGSLMMERGSTDAEVLVLQQDGEFRLRTSTEDAALLLNHGDQFQIGTRRVEFRLLDEVSVDDGDSVDQARPLLVHHDGTRLGRQVPISKDLFTIGRGRDADIQITEDASLSRVHCQIVKEGETLFVEDAGSSNGTLLNGIAVDGRLELTPNDRITIGQSELEFIQPQRIVGPNHTLHDLIADEPTDVLPVRERARRGLPVEEGVEKLRVVNSVLLAVFRSLDAAEGSGRGQAFLNNLVAARPRSYQGLLDELEVEQGLPTMDVLYNLAQRPEQEQRPLLNFVLSDLIDRAVDAAGEILEEDPMEVLLGELAATRYRDHLRF